jgi:glucose-6-phosphate 1-dehydrogenase
LFTRNDETLSQWAIIDPILKTWSERQQPELQTYEAGTPGPAAADDLIGEGRHWRGL